jgi:predicted dehydrogenase
MIKIGLCGFGYWGATLFRTIAASRGFRIVAVAELDPSRRQDALRRAPTIKIFDEATLLIDSAEIDAVVIATPVRSHYALAAKALSRGLHTLVEKPLCSTVDECRELLDLAKRSEAVLLVDHVYVFHEAAHMIKALKQSGALGTISYYDSLRVNLGLFQPDVSVLWDLAPHDFSIMNYILEEDPVHIETTGYCHVNPNLPDIVYITLHYASRMIAHLNLSWMSPVKVRRIAIGGSKQILVWDDLNSEERIKIYNSGIEIHPEDQRSVIVPGYRVGDIISPRVPNHEPLARLVEHFESVIRQRIASPVDGLAGMRVVSLLERAQRALDASLRALSEQSKLRRAP